MRPLPDNNSFRLPINRADSKGESSQMLPPITSKQTTAAMPAAAVELGLRDRGPAVSDLQQALNQAGANLTVDGDFGPRTEQAVREFQKEHGLKPDGIAGPKTMAALAEAQPQSSAAPSPATHLDLNKELSSPDSRLSVAIGVAEGTRTPDGGRTPAYAGHPDPKGGLNVGTFSYQGQANSPRQADELQLQNFRSLKGAFEEACRKNGLDPTNPLLAGSCFDLYNQAPKAVTGKGGFLDQLSTLAKKGVTPENIAEARYRSYYDPDKGKFDTTFTLPDLKADQMRRTEAIASVLGKDAPAAYSPTPVPPGKIGFNSQGPEVVKLKQALKDAGFYHGPVNDKMGRQGIDALRQAKLALHIGGPPDIAGAETIQKISDYAKSVPHLHVEVDFVSQFDARVPGDYSGQSASLKCDNACEYMMRNTSNPDARVTPGQDDSKVTAFNGGGLKDSNIQYVESQLRSGKPVMIGVNHPNGTAGTGNKNGINHYLVATGIGTDDKGRTYISFNDPAQTSAELGQDTNAENRLYLNNGQFQQDRATDPYQLRGVVQNL
jgi:peptidoglycan hydrolase-like protein with peptidoglycan-binding domain